MKKEDLEKELKTILKDAEHLQAKSELELATAEFLRNEANKLMAKMDSPEIPFDQKEEIGRQMLALQTRLEHEVRTFEMDVPKMAALEKQLNYLRILLETGQVEM